MVMYGVGGEVSSKKRDQEPSEAPAAKQVRRRRSPEPHYYNGRIHKYDERGRLLVPGLVVPMTKPSLVMHKDGGEWARKF